MKITAKYPQAGFQCFVDRIPSIGMKSNSSPEVYRVTPVLRLELLNVLMRSF